MGAVAGADAGAGPAGWPLGCLAGGPAGRLRWFAPMPAPCLARGLAHRLCERRGNDAPAPSHPETGSVESLPPLREKGGTMVVPQQPMGSPRSSRLQKMGVARKQSGPLSRAARSSPWWMEVTSWNGNATGPFRRLRSARRLRPWRTFHWDRWTGTSGRHRRCPEAERSSASWHRRWLSG